MGEEAPIGIKETKDVVAFALTLGEDLSSALADGAVTLSEIPTFLDAVGKLPAAISGIASVPTELSHLTDEEKAELIQYVQDNFKIESEKVEGAILDGLKLVSGIYDYVKKYFVANA